MTERQAILWQLDNLIDQLAEQEKEIIVRRYVQGERVEDVYESLGISRATAFRRLEAGIMHLAGMYNKLYDAVA